MYCTCGHFMKDDTTENKKYISSVLDLFSIPNFYIRKGRPHGHRYGKKPGCKEYHTANQLQRRCRKKKDDNIHYRFIRVKFFRKTMIELGRSEEIILEMDRLANEGHSHFATQEEIDVYRGNWHCRHCTTSKSRRTTRTMKIGRKVPPHGGNGTPPGGIPIKRLHHKDGVNTDRTAKLVQSVN